MRAGLEVGMEDGTVNDPVPGAPMPVTILCAFFSNNGRANWPWMMLLICGGRLEVVMWPGLPRLGRAVPVATGL